MNEEDTQVGVDRDLRPEEELRAAADLTDQLIREFEEHPDERVRDKVFQLLNAVDRLHRPGLRALMQFLESKKLYGIIEQALSDPVIRTLLELYDLLPQTEQQPPPPTAGSSLLSLEEVVEAPGKPIFLDVVRLEEVPPGCIKGVMLERVNVLICNLDGDVYALQNACQGRGLPLDTGELRGDIIICRWHGCRYDARTGKAIPGEDDRHMAEVDLELFPVAVTEGVIQVAVNIPHKGGLISSGLGKRRS